MIRVLVVHQTQLISSIIANVLDEEEDITVIAQASSTEEALECLENQPCEMVLVAATLPDNGALQITEAIADMDTNTKVLVIGLPKSKNAILQYVAAGASGYVLQEVSTERLLEHIRAAYDGKAIISPDIAAALMNHINELAQISTQTNIDPSAYAQLTPREREVLDLIGEDFSNQQIADKLYIEVGTVKNHVHNILKKLDVSSRHEAAAFLPFVKDE
ncbi:MAG TPA: response regulator transcription factor [Candidatus Sulfomarinibacteraceae bacterium]|nr:response regulator transcription factor [Candidatus Sulfomarinibacteraceae bacterium]